MADDGEVRIVAVLDTTDITNGVDRVAGAGRRMKQVWEETTLLGFPVDQVKQDLQQIETVSAESGAKSGLGFFQGFLGKLLLRDAIYGVIRGLEETFKEVAQGLNASVGEAGKTTFSVWTAAADAIRAAVSLIPAVDRAQQEYLASNIGAINARETERISLDRFREDPSSLKDGSKQIAARLEQLEESRADDRRNNARYNADVQSGAGRGGFPGADLDDKKMAEREKNRAQDQAFLQGILSIAKEKERKDASESTEAARRSQAASFRAEESIETADEFMRGQIRAEEAKKEKADEAAAKKAARKEATEHKKIQERALSTQITGDEQEHRAAEKDLDFGRRQLEHQHATSAVMINGGVFGRNNSAIALVQHAAQQVSLLRSIDNELKAIRQEKSDLTLL